MKMYETEFRDWINLDHVSMITIDDEKMGEDDQYYYNVYAKLCNTLDDVMIKSYVTHKEAQTFVQSLGYILVL